MNKLIQIQARLKDAPKLPSEKHTMFYKTGLGDYAEHDQFIGVTVPILRKIAKEFSELSLSEIKILVKSPINEERFLALIILVDQYQKANPQLQETLFQFYIDHSAYVNNWNLVDASAHLIVGKYLFTLDRKLLLTLVRSDNLWQRRIAIVSTWYFIRQNDLEWTFKLAELLLNDPHDLIHKSAGWMLREAGKKDQNKLIEFLGKHATNMPRTMLRYAIEKFPEKQRKAYLQTSKSILS